MSYYESLPEAPGLTGLAENECEIVDLQVLKLRAGESHALDAGDREYGVVVLTGIVTITIGDEEFADLGGRESVFDGPPTTVYLPAGKRATIVAAGEAELALASATTLGIPVDPYLVRPEDITPGTWGSGNTARHHNLIITDARPSERMYLAEITVSDGNWATYPPHKHEVDADDGSEIFQEEIYYYRVNPEQGLGFAALYGGKVGGDTATVVRDRTVHTMPFGYHTVTAAPGYSVWYLAVYAGNRKAAHPFVDPAHRWLT